MPSFRSLGSLFNCPEQKNFFACVLVSYDLVNTHYKTLNNLYIRSEGVKERLILSVHR